MSNSSDASLLRERFNTAWSSLRPTVPIHWPNTIFDPPSTSWVRFSIAAGSSERAAIGPTEPLRPFFQYGRVWIQCFTPKHGGDAPALAMADDAAGIFREWSSGGLRCFAPEISVIPINDDDPWFQVNISTPYRSLHRF